MFNKRGKRLSESRERTQRKERMQSENGKNKLRKVWKDPSKEKGVINEKNTRKRSDKKECKDLEKKRKDSAKGEKKKAGERQGKM